MLSHRAREKYLACVSYFCYLFEEHIARRNNNKIWWKRKIFANIAWGNWQIAITTLLPKACWYQIIWGELLSLFSYLPTRSTLPNLYIYIYIYIYICMYVYIYTYIYIYTCMCFDFISQFQIYDCHIYTMQMHIVLELGNK